MIGNRKLEHIRFCTENDVSSISKSTMLEDVDFVHDALPEIDRSEIDCSVEFLDKKLKYPLLIEAMTGGIPEALEINKNLATAAQRLEIGMGVGSQRPMLEDKETYESYMVRKFAPHILLFGNIGAPQLRQYPKERLVRLATDIGADALAVHLNNLQETIQPEGETALEGVLGEIRKLAGTDMPIIVKETGAGMSWQTVQELFDAKVYAVDVGGAGGTSFAAVEYLRSKKEPDKDFVDWGIPTAASIVEARNAPSVGRIIASGGIRRGADVAKAIALGADLVGIAQPLLGPAQKSPAAVQKHLEGIIDELKNVMLLVGAKNIGELRKTEIIVSGELKEWLSARRLEL